MRKAKEERQTQKDKEEAANPTEVLEDIVQASTKQEEGDQPKTEEIKSESASAEEAAQAQTESAKEV